MEDRKQEGAPMPSTTPESIQLRSAVHRAYCAAAEKPGEKHAFPVGRALAERLGYPAGLLDALPAVSVDAFAGVSNAAMFAELPSGASVLDLGCGAGLDSLIASRRVGPTGHVVGIDFSDSMLARARHAASMLWVNVIACRGDAERLPVRSASITVALVNGIFNLNPARTGSGTLLLSSFEGRSSFRTWLYRVVVNHVLNAGRGRREPEALSFGCYGHGLDTTPDLDLPDQDSVPADVSSRRSSDASGRSRA
jgi:arsenite methyltransferase